MADRPIADTIEISAPQCIACDADLEGDEEEFCEPCALKIESDADRCPMCKCSPCADPSGCRAEASREDRAERVRDGES